MKIGTRPSINKLFHGPFRGTENKRVDQQLVHSTKASPGA